VPSDLSCCRCGTGPHSCTHWQCAQTLCSSSKQFVRCILLQSACRRKKRTELWSTTNKHLKNEIWHLAGIIKIILCTTISHKCVFEKKKVINAFDSNKKWNECSYIKSVAGLFYPGRLQLLHVGADGHSLAKCPGLRQFLHTRSLQNHSF